MNRTGAFLVLALAAAVAVGGCLLKRTPASRTYVLDPTEARGVGAPAGPAVAVVGVAKVSVPDWLDRPTVLARAASGEIVADDFSRWGEPLPRGVQRVLMENLAALLPDRRILAEPIPPRLTVDYRVEVTIVDVARQGDGTVSVETRWDVIGGKGGALVRRRSSDRGRAAAPGVQDVVAGMNEALATLSREIADAVRTLPLPSNATREREPWKWFQNPVVGDCGPGCGLARREMRACRRRQSEKRPVGRRPVDAGAFLRHVETERG